MIGERADRVVKVGGDELRAGPALAELVRHVARARRAGHRWVLVHGGGDEVTERAAELGLPTTRHRGQRVTDDRMREVVVEVLAGRIAARIVGALEAGGVPAVAVSGVSGSLLEVRPEGDPPGRLGWVGRPHAVHAELLERLVQAGFTPVVAPLGVDRAGEVYNVNADLAAGAISGALGTPLCLVTDVPGLLGADGQRVVTLGRAQARRLIDDGVATDGMIPKLEGGLAAIAAGAPEAWIGPITDLRADGPRPGSGTRMLASRPSARLPLLAASAEGVS